MKYLTQGERTSILGDYTSPTGLYDYLKTTPFLGEVTCSETELVAGSFHELLLTYTVGSSGLADGAWIKATFKFYSDWALFQTSDPTAANYVSAEYEAISLLTGQIPATVQSLSVRFDQKGHERPFQKSVIVDIVDGFLNPGDKIHLRLGDRRAGGGGTRVQTFVEKDFRFRFYVDPVGTSRFAAVPTDVVLQIIPDKPIKIVTIAPRFVQPSDKEVPIVIRLEDRWGNTITNTASHIVLKQIDVKSSKTTVRQVTLPSRGWSTTKQGIIFPEEGQYRLEASIPGSQIAYSTALITVDSASSTERVYYADLHVHSDDTVGTNDSVYNLSYAQECAALDIVGYTANDFNITEKNWNSTVQLIDNLNKDGEFVIYPGTEWCGNTAVGGDHNVVFLDEQHREFPYDKDGNVARSFEWNDQMVTDTIAPGTWPIDDLYATYAHSPESHLLIPHIGGRRANLGWHHPKLERLIEIGSAWGHFEWFLKEAIGRGYRLGVSANSDEHRGRCGGGVPGTAVFGTRGGLTGVLASHLDRKTVATSLRSRHTFATTGQRLVGLSWIPNSQDSSNPAIQGDELDLPVSNGAVEVKYRFLGQSAGWESIKAYGYDGLLSERDVQTEIGRSGSRYRVSWGGARVKDRYREAIWQGRVQITNGISRNVERSCPDDVNPEESHWVDKEGNVNFRSSTSGDRDGLILDIEWLSSSAGKIVVEGTIQGYVKVGDPLRPNPFRHCPTFSLATTSQTLTTENKITQDLGGTDLFVSIDRVAPKGSLPTDISGSILLQPKNGPHGAAPIWFVATQADGAKVWTSAIWVNFR